MSEKTKEVPRLADATYAHTLVIKSTHEYKVHGPYGKFAPYIHGTVHDIVRVYVRAVQVESGTFREKIWGRLYILKHWKKYDANQSLKSLWKFNQKRFQIFALGQAAWFWYNNYAFSIFLLMRELKPAVGLLSTWTVLMYMWRITLETQGTEVGFPVVPFVFQIFIIYTYMNLKLC